MAGLVVARESFACTFDDREIVVRVGDQVPADYLLEVAITTAARYDTAKSGNGYSFPSFVTDIMNHRVVDFFRSRQEGFRDGQYYDSTPVVFAGVVAEDFADGTVDFDDPFDQPDIPTAAEWLIDERHLSASAAFTLTRLVSPYLEDGSMTRVPKRAGVTMTRATEMLQELRDELAQNRFGEHATEPKPPSMIEG